MNGTPLHPGFVSSASSAIAPMQSPLQALPRNRKYAGENGSLKLNGDMRTSLNSTNASKAPAFHERSGSDNILEPNAANPSPNGLGCAHSEQSHASLTNGYVRPSVEDAVDDGLRRGDQMKELPLTTRKASSVQFSTEKQSETSVDQSRNDEDENEDDDDIVLLDYDDEDEMLHSTTGRASQSGIGDDTSRSSTIAVNDLEPHSEQQRSYHTETRYEGYMLERAEPASRAKYSWARVGKRSLPFGDKILVEMVKNHRQRTQTTPQQDFESLTSNQQGVIERLIRQRQQDKSNQRVEVELVDVQRFGTWHPSPVNGRTKIVKRIQIIIKRISKYKVMRDTEKSSGFNNIYDETIDLADPPTKSKKSNKNLQFNDYGDDSGPFPPVSHPYMAPPPPPPPPPPLFGGPFQAPFESVPMGNDYPYYEPLDNLGYSRPLTNYDTLPPPPPPPPPMRSRRPLRQNSFQNRFQPDPAFSTGFSTHATLGSDPRRRDGPFLDEMSMNAGRPGSDATGHRSHPLRSITAQVKLCDNISSLGTQVEQLRSITANAPVNLLNPSNRDDLLQLLAKLEWAIRLVIQNAFMRSDLLYKAQRTIELLIGDMAKLQDMMQDDTKSIYSHSYTETEHEADPELVKNIIFVLGTYVDELIGIMSR